MGPVEQGSLPAARRVLVLRPGYPLHLVDFFKPGWARDGASLLSCDGPVRIEMESGPLHLSAAGGS